MNELLQITAGVAGAADLRTNSEKPDLQSFPNKKDLRTACGKSAGNANGRPLPMLKPIPLPEKPQAITYPVGALGPILGNAAKALAYHVQVPLGIACQSVLAASSLVAQQHVDVARGKISTGPVSLYCLSVAESGDRKSATDKLALKPIRGFEARRREELNSEWSRYRSNLLAWEMRLNSVKQSFKPNGKHKAMSESDEQRLASALLELESEKPTPPPRASITFTEPTPEAIWRHYQQGVPSAGLFSDEAVSFFNGHGMSADAKGRMIGSLSQLWDGSTLQRTRAAEGESGEMDNRRLSAHLMVQPVVSAEVLSDPLLLGQGFIARFLVCHEDSIAGTRFLKDRNPEIGADNDPAINAYWDRLSELLAIPLKTNEETGGLELHTLKITGEAYQYWEALHDGIEKHLVPGGSFVDIKAFASKAAENAARMAAVMAFVEGEEITACHIQRAGELVSYYLSSMAIRTGEAANDLADVQARELLEWIKQHGGKLEAAQFKRLPSAYRKSSIARAILERLRLDGHLTAELGTGGKAISWEVIEC
ncbi:YfjI family protein [Spongiibacter marinus]|uniref:YfjI family protein n=1 Tax=Spongiibacter marinus TaxID=354246 RepID=UPI0004020411|nr:YfjI family protein [Spongiibacter marinus]